MPQDLMERVKELEAELLNMTLTNDVAQMSILSLTVERDILQNELEDIKKEGWYKEPAPKELTPSEEQWIKDNCEF